MRGIFNKIMYYFQVICIPGFLLLPGCSKEDQPSADMGYGYFPVNPGHWVLYQVDSIAWDDFTSTVDTFSFQIKEVLESTFIDDQGRPNIRIERYIRQSDTSEWIIRDVWFGLRSASTAEKVEENERFVKLIFPVKEDAEWDGNIGNNLGAQDYTYINTHQPYQSGGMSYDSTVTVIQQDYTTAISRNYEEEIFASGVGMVYKKYVNLETLPTGVIKKGCDYTYVALGWGD